MDLDSHLINLAQLRPTGLYSANNRFMRNRVSIGGYASVLFVGLAGDWLQQPANETGTAVMVTCPQKQKLQDVLQGHTGTLMDLMANVIAQVQSLPDSNESLNNPLFEALEASEKTPHACLTQPQDGCDG